jgi:hypothetical protein
MGCVPRVNWLEVLRMNGLRAEGELASIIPYIIAVVQSHCYIPNKQVSANYYTAPCLRPAFASPPSLI